LVVHIEPKGDVANDGVTCDLQYNASCTTRFIYSYPQEESKLRIKVTVLDIMGSFCPEGISAIYYIVGIIGAILLIGLLTLFLWKLFTYWHDRMEFQKFEKERAAAKWDTVKIV
jgi:integrin beta 3